MMGTLLYFTRLGKEQHKNTGKEKKHSFLINLHKKPSNTKKS